MANSKVILVSPEGNALAEFIVGTDEQGWYTGNIVTERFPREIKDALDWYDEVVRDQMLSYLDEAASVIERFHLVAKFPDGSSHKVYSLHVSPENEVWFRITPVPAPV